MAPTSPRPPDRRLTLPLLTAALVALAVAAAGCSARRQAALVAQPISAERSWVSPLHRDAPLVGRIWDVRAGRFVEEPALEGALARADVVLLGETHDNPDHHLLQARLVRSLTTAGRRPALAFEMISADRQPEVDAALARAGTDADALGKALDWDKSGWPPFAMYRPVFRAGLDAGLPIVAANLSRKLGHAVVRDGAGALPAPVRDRLDRAGPLTPAAAAELREEMKEDHCGALPDSLLDPMVLAQRARDAQMAARLDEVRAARGAVLVTGAGHARRDRGVPAFLALDPAPPSIVSVGLREVDPDRRSPSDYEADYGGPLPYDFVVFTPGAEREDPCEKLRAEPIHPPAPAAQPPPGAPAPAAPGQPTPPAPGAPPQPAPGAAPPGR